MRYLEPEKLPNTPKDDRHLPDMLFGIYDDLVIFDHVQKTVLVLANAHIETGDKRSYKEIYASALARIEEIIKTLQEPIAFELTSVDLTREFRPQYSTYCTKEAYEQAVIAAKEYIKAGDIFQVVLSAAASKSTTKARPFDIYRTLRVINPSPFMFYLSSPECILVGSSPEIMCRVQDGIITNRAQAHAGTPQTAGQTVAEDKALEEDLLAGTPRNACRAHHAGGPWAAMFDSRPGGGTRQREGERHYDRGTLTSHVMHIVSNVTGKLAADKTVFDALQTSAAA